MFIYLDRVTRRIWIADANGNARERTKASPKARIVDEAGKFLTSQGYVRTGDYTLLANGSPIRRATIARSSGQVPDTGGRVSASAISRILNEGIGVGVFDVAQGGLPQNRHTAFVGGRDPKRLQEAFTLLRSKGYRLEFTSTGQYLRIVGKATTPAR